MRPRLFKLLIFQAIVLALLSLPVCGQKGTTDKECAEANYDCLIIKYSATIESNPNDADAYYERGVAYSSNQKYAQAIKDFDKAISLNSKFENAFYWRGYIYIRFKLYAEAIKNFNRVKELNPANKDADVSLEYVRAMIKRGGLPIQEYNWLIELESDKAEYYYARADYYFRLKDFYKAIADASKAIELDAKYTEAYGVRSDSYCKVGRWKESTDDIRSYENLIGKSSRAVCYVNLEESLKYCAEDDFNCKMIVFSSGIDNPNQITGRMGLGDYYAGRGIIYHKKGESERAFSDFENAEKFSYTIKNESINLYLGNFLLKKGKHDLALRKFILALEAKAESAESFLGIGEIYVIKREYEKAFDYFDGALFLNPRLSKAYLGRGAMYLERAKNYGEFENDAARAADAYRKAIKDFDSVIEIDLGNTAPEVYVKRAKAYERLGEQAKADADRAKAEEIAEKP